MSGPPGRPAVPATSKETGMADEDGITDDIDAALVEDLLRWHQGRGPRSEVPEGREDLVALVEVLTGSAEVIHPTLADDPVARRLGLIEADTVEVSLHEL